MEDHAEVEDGAKVKGCSTGVSAGRGAAQGCSTRVKAMAAGKGVQHRGAARGSRGAARGSWVPGAKVEDPDGVAEVGVDAEEEPEREWQESEDRARAS